MINIKIIVCLKQVPGTTEIKINPENNTLIREGVESIINPFDTYAIEEGVRLKERLSNTDNANQTHDSPKPAGQTPEVISISMGPPHSIEILRNQFP